MINDREYPLILGQPFSYTSQLSYMYENNRQYTLLVNPKITKQVQVQVLVQKKPGMRIDKEVEPENKQLTH